MKIKTFIILCISIGFYSLGFGQDMFTNIGFDELKKQAKSYQKPYFVEITADWCLPCKLMDETVFQDVAVINYTKDNYIAVKYDVDNFDAMFIKDKYNAPNVPTILIFDSKGNLLEKLEGLQTGTQFLEILKKNNS